MDVRRKNTSIFIVTIIFAVSMCAIMVTFFLGEKTKVKRNTSYQSKGINAIVDNKGTAYFFEEDQLLSFEGDFLEGKSTPDHKRYVLLKYDGTLVYYESEGSQPVTIASDVESILKITNTECVYIVNEQITTEDILEKMSNSYSMDKTLDELKKEFATSYDNTVGEAKRFYKEVMGYSYSSNTNNERVTQYDFKSKSVTELQDNTSDILFADNGTTYACINEENKLFLYVEGERNVKELCNVGENAILCGISSDGKRVIWSEEENNELMVYMMKNGIPERISKLEKKQKYSTYPRVVFFDHGFVVLCRGHNTMVYVKDDEIIEIPFEGILDVLNVLDSKGNVIENSICTTDSLYFSITTHEDGLVWQLYKLDKSGNITEVASDLSAQYYIRADKLFYVDQNNDFYVSSIGESGMTEPICLTTEIEGLNVSRDGSMVYVVKAQALYYWETDDSSYQFHVICNDFKEDSQIYLTDNANQIFYITNNHTIKGLYSTVGTLYSYKKGEDMPEEIATNIYLIEENGSREYSSVNPIIVQYAKQDDQSRSLYNIGRLNNDEMEIVIRDILIY